MHDQRFAPPLVRFWLVWMVFCGTTQLAVAFTYQDSQEAAQSSLRDAERQRARTQRWKDERDQDRLERAQRRLEDRLREMSTEELYDRLERLND